MGSSQTKNNISENVNVNAVSGSAIQKVEKEFDVVKIAVIAFVVTLLTLILLRQIKKYLTKKITAIQITRV
jgi:hypothetical protein